METTTNETTIKSCSKSSSCSSCGSKGSFDWLADIELPPHAEPYPIVQVKFKGTRTDFYRLNNQADLYLNDYVVVEAENGQDIGKISMKGELARLKVKSANLPEDHTFKKIIRAANEQDMQRYKECKDLEVPTQYRARTIALELGLTMKLSDVEYQADRRKAIFYYTAEERVDFRELIKRLADEFRIRIEMKQIGYRQEAGRLGGIGSCGRELCCNTWLTDFKLVHTNAARYQNLSLNQLKLSGQCGRLKCCLNFELDAYQEALREFPEQDTIFLEFAEGARYRSVKTDILKRLIWFMPLNETGGDWMSFQVDEVKEYMRLNKEGEFPELPVVVPKAQEKEKVELEFTNDVGIGSLTRLDERSKKNKNKSKNRNNKPEHRNRPDFKNRSTSENPNSDESRPAENRSNDSKPRNENHSGQRNRNEHRTNRDRQPREPRPDQGPKPDSENQSGEKPQNNPPRSEHRNEQRNNRDRNGFRRNRPRGNDRNSDANPTDKPTE